MKAKYKMSEFLKREFRKTFPLYILGMLFETIAIYITLLNTQIIGRILDMILQANVSKEQIMQELYKLIFYSAIVFIPNTIKRNCFSKDSEEKNKSIWICLDKKQDVSILTADILFIKKMIKFVKKCYLFEKNINI